MSFFYLYLCNVNFKITQIMELGGCIKYGPYDTKYPIKNKCNLKAYTFYKCTFYKVLVSLESKNLMPANLKS